MVRIKSIADFKHSKMTSEYPKRSVQFKKVINIFIVYLYIIAAFGMCIILPNEHFTTALFYSAVILCAVMFAGLAQQSKTSFGFNIFLGLSFSVLFFIIGFRNYSGLDDHSYIRIFNEVAQAGWFSRFQITTMEPGYLFLNDLVSFFTDNYLYMQLITSFIPLFLFYRGFKKYKSIISIPMAVFLLSTILYFQILSVGLVRMFIALSIVFNAFYYIPQGKSKRYIFTILIASMFHYSALFMLVLTYFTLNKNNISKKARGFIITGFVVTPLIFLAVAHFIVPLLGNRYVGYGTVDSLSFGLSSFSSIPIIIILLLFHKKFKGESSNYFKLFLTIYSLSLIISLYGTMVPLGRVVFYANIALFLAASMINKLLSKNSKKLIFCAMIIFYGFFYVYWTQFILESHIPSLFPYRNIFFEV